MHAIQLKLHEWVKKKADSKKFWRHMVVKNHFEYLNTWINFIQKNINNYIASGKVIAKSRPA